MALSLLETKDHQLSTPSQESTHQRPGDRQNQRNSVQLSSVPQPQERGHTQLADVVGRRKNANASQSGPWAKVSQPQTIPETELQSSTLVTKCDKASTRTTQTLCVSRLSGSVSKQDKVEKDNQMMDESEVNQSEKTKRSKNRRQRRKGNGQQIVGLPRIKH